MTPSGARTCAGVWELTAYTNGYVANTNHFSGELHRPILGRVRVRGVRETGELLMSSSSVLRQRGLELYVINTATNGYIGPYNSWVPPEVSHLLPNYPPDTSRLTTARNNNKQQKY